jgi:hypothetical protein
MPVTTGFTGFTDDTGMHDEKSQAFPVCPAAAALVRYSGPAGVADAQCCSASGSATECSSAQALCPPALFRRPSPSPGPLFNFLSQPPSQCQRDHVLRVLSDASDAGPRARAARPRGH